MDIAMIGLGKMGASMAERLLGGGHRVVGFDPDRNAVAELEKKGAEGAASLSELKAKLDPPRKLWLMVPAGEPTENTLVELGELLSEGDVIVDGGNSDYRDTLRRAAALKEKGIYLVDAGTSGGVWGLTEGYSLMIGGEEEPVKLIEPALQTLAPEPDRGWGRVGPAGAGHFVKMVHNGIEYGMMEAYAEGFALMKAKEEFNLDLEKIAGIWRYGSVIRSWLLELIERALAEDTDLSSIKAYVSDSGEGRWTVREGIDLGIPLPVISLALQERFRSRLPAPFADKLLAALRRQFGGHAVKEEDA